MNAASYRRAHEQTLATVHNLASLHQQAKLQQGDLDNQMEALQHPVVALRELPQNASTTDLAAGFTSVIAPTETLHTTLGAHIATLQQVFNGVGEHLESLKNQREHILANAHLG